MDRGGKRRSFYARSRLEAEDRLADARKRDRQGLRLDPGEVTLDAWLARWLEAKRGRVRLSTWSTYDGHLRRYVVGTPLGARALVDLTPERLTSHYGGLGRAIAPQTVRHVAGILHQALGAAQRAGELATNPADFAEPPRVARAAMRTLSPGQLDAYMRAAYADELAALWVCGVTTGMRLGELLGLRWRAVDLRRGVVSVDRSLTVAGQRAALTEPKSRASRRSVSLPAIAAYALREHHVKDYNRATSPNPEFADLVFTRTDGEPLDPRRVTSRLFPPVLAAAGLPRMRFHDLRHTAATLLLGAGEHPKVVSAMLGHTSIRTTLDLYSHVSDTMTRQAAESMDRLVGWEPED